MPKEVLEEGATQNDLKGEATQDDLDTGATSEEISGEGTEESTPTGTELYDIEGVGQTTLEDIKEAFEYKNNYKKWSTGLSDKGAELNKLKSEIENEKRESEAFREDANRWRLLEKNMTPEAEAEIRRLLQEGDKVSPALQKFRQEYDKKFEELEYEKATLSLKEVLPDFKTDDVESYIKSINFDNPRDLLEMAYYAVKGKGLPLELQKARAKDVESNRKARGLPPVSGGKKAETPTYKTVQEALEAYNKEHGVI